MGGGKCCLQEFKLEKGVANRRLNKRKLLLTGA